MFLELALCAILIFLTFLILRRKLSSGSQLKQLSQIPGPAALPVIGHLLHFRTGLLHRTFHNLAAKFGPLIHLHVGSVSAVIIASPELAKEFYKNHDLDFDAHNKNFAIQRLTGDAAFAFSPYGKYWTLLKKLCVSEFLGSRRVITHFLPIRVDETKFLVRDLLTKAKLGEQVNFTKVVTKMTTNILSRMMMGVRCSDTKEGEEQGLIVHEVAKIFGTPNLADVFPILKFFDIQGIKKKCNDLHKRYDAMIEGILVKREEFRRKTKELGEAYVGENGVEDFLDILYDLVEDENAEIKFTRNHIKGVILDFFTAGTDSSAIIIEWTLSELINNPKIMKKAQEEIDRVIGKERLVKESDVPNLPYLQALVKETLRFHTSFPVYARKALKDCTLMGYKIPAGTLLFVNVFSMVRDPNHWESPLEFKPERFLNNDDVSLRDVKGQHFELLTFGAGRRICPGIILALLELQTTVATVIQCFDWKVTTNNGVVDMEERGGLTVARARDLLCVPTTRIDDLEAKIEK